PPAPCSCAFLLVHRSRDVEQQLVDAAIDGLWLAFELVRMDRDEAELAAALAVRSRHERAERGFARLSRELRVRHAAALEHDETAAGGEYEHEPPGLAAHGDGLREFLDFEHAERALERARAAVRPHGFEPRHRRRSGERARRRGDGRWRR